MKFLNILVSYFLISAALLFASPAMAVDEVANTTSPHHFLFNFGWTSGGVGFGLDYENNFHRTYGLGGYVRLYSGDDTNTPGDITTFGIFIRPHFTRQAWDFSVSPGFGFVQQDYAAGNESYFGPSLGIGLMYQISYNIAVGVENFQIYGWFGDDQTLGAQSHELLAKFRYSF